MPARPPRRSARRVPQTGERQEWTLATDLNAIAPVVDAVQSLCRAAGLPEKQCALNIPVAITEALANAMLRGNEADPTRCVHVVVELSAARLVVDVSDEGQGNFQVDSVQCAPDAPDWLEREDGRGIFLMRSLMDEVLSVSRATRRGREQRGHTLRLVLQRV
ncbi:MAG: ATP-binding protein [Gemmatimonadaceae bacterium]|nr:ATP-binding protein [Gemmatimonadaceae bacterium]